MMVLAAAIEPNRLGDFFVSFLGIVFEGAPYIVVGTLLSGFIDVFLPAKLIDRVMPRNKLISTLIAGLLGLILPVCECAIVPVIRRLVGKGLPLSCAITYMLAAPIMNPIVALSTYTAFPKNVRESGPLLLSWADLSHPMTLLQHLCADMPMVVARLSLGYVVAVLAGLLVAFMKPSQVLRDEVAKEVDAPVSNAAPASFDTKLVRAMRSSMKDFLDTGMFFTLGVGITALFNTQIDQAALAQNLGNGWMAIPALMVLALVLSLCSTSDAFIAANMPAFGFAPKLAFLVFGPMMDFKLLFMYSAVFKRRIILVMLLGLMLVIGLLSGPWAALIQRLATSS